MTVLLFTGVLLGAMALGMPIAFALLVSALAMMWQLDALDPQAVALQMLNAADSFGSNPGTHFSCWGRSSWIVHQDARDDVKTCRRGRTPGSSSSNPAGTLIVVR